MANTKIIFGYNFGISLIRFQSQVNEKYSKGKSLTVRRKKLLTLVSLQHLKFVTENPYSLLQQQYNYICVYRIEILFAKTNQCYLANANYLINVQNRHLSCLQSGLILENEECPVKKGLTMNFHP